MNAPGAGGGPAPTASRPRARVDPVGIALAVGVVAAAVAGTVGGALVAPSLLCNCPEGAVGWVRTSAAASHPSAAGHEYVFTILEVVDPPLTYGQFAFWFLAATGSNLAPDPSWTVTVISTSGNFTAGIVLPSQQLSAGGTVAITSDAVLTVFTGPTSLSGGQIILNAAGGISTVPVQ